MKYETGAVLFTINLSSLALFYERVVGLRVLLTEKDHIRLENGSFRLTVHQIPERYAKNITIKSPPVIRENTAVKLAFRVHSIAKAREAAEPLGGIVYARDREWEYDGDIICDGYDPDGNVFQLWQAKQ
jgi:predicted enzyme related to lactoylglutathione lyase